MNYFLATNFELKLMSVSILLLFKTAFLPSIPLLIYMGIAIALDFITGVIKAVVLKEIRTSSGYRKTVIKFLQYGGSIAVGIVLGNANMDNGREAFKVVFQYFTDGLVIFILYIEITSIFENLYAVDKNSMISKYFIAPVLKILTWQIKNNPVIKQADELSDK